MVTRSAGGVVIGYKDNIVIVNQNNDSWSLPKGRLDKGEGLVEAAKREIYEETGIKHVVILKELGTYSRPTIGIGGVGEDTSRMKKMTFFLCKTRQTKLSPIDPDNPVAKWVSIDEALKMLLHHKDKEFLLKHKHEIQLAIDNL